jgi:hypothetical protein
MAYRAGGTGLSGRARVGVPDLQAWSGRPPAHVGCRISRRGNLRDVVRWADRENRVPELFEKAVEEQPGNARLALALRHVRDPLLIEDRWFARQVPVATWLLGAANVALLLLVVKVFFANLINTVRLLSTLALAALVALAVWRLYTWLVGGAVRAWARCCDAGIHSRPKGLARVCRCSPWW